MPTDQRPGLTAEERAMPLSDHWMVYRVPDGTYASEVGGVVGGPFTEERAALVSVANRLAADLDHARERATAAEADAAALRNALSLLYDYERLHRLDFVRLHGEQRIDDVMCQVEAVLPLFGEPTAGTQLLARLAALERIAAVAQHLDAGQSRDLWIELHAALAELKGA